MGDIIAKAKAALARVEVDIIPESTEAAAQPASFRDVLPPQPVEPTHDSYSLARGKWEKEQEMRHGCHYAGGKCLVHGSTTIAAPEPLTRET